MVSPSHRLREITLTGDQHDVMSHNIQVSLVAVGKSNRIVIELPPGLKLRLYAILRSRGRTLREWFLATVEKELLSADKKQRRNGQAKHR
jgi:hypothetical protein